MVITPQKVEHYDLELVVNGQTIHHRVPTHLRLLDFLRDYLRITGTKEVCREGECGACTVVMNGATVNACLIFAVEAHGADIVTIEGIGEKGNLNNLQQAFVEYHSVQCGYCIPGFVLSGEQIIKDCDDPGRQNIKENLAGNICRCTGYHKIIDAIEAVGKRE